MQKKSNHAWQKTAWILVGINLILLFWLEGGWRVLGGDSNTGHEPQRLDMQVEPQALQPIASAAAAASESAQVASQSASESSDAEKPTEHNDKEASH
jgi:hypothetical protein